MTKRKTPKLWIATGPLVKRPLRSPSLYLKRPITPRERAELADLEYSVAVWAKLGRRIAINVQNRRNPNGFSLRWEPALQGVKIERVINRQWAEDNRYRW